MALTMKLTTSASFRAIHKILDSLTTPFHIGCNAPSHSTIGNWVKKYGHHQLRQSRDFSGEWVLILDESVQFGQNKLLVIYGIRQDHIDFTRPLRFSDLVPLTVACRSSWTGEAIYEHLRSLQDKLEGISYAIADEANSIKKALRQAGITHIHDLTHYIALVVKHIYEQDSQFIGYTKKMACVRGSLCLSKVAHVLPPAQRVNSRFMNLKPISDWGQRVLHMFETTNSELHSREKQALRWVCDYRELITELAELNWQINQIQTVLKTKGVSRQTIKQCKSVLKGQESHRLAKFGQGMKAYFDQLEQLITKPKKLLCSSDIIESAFAKYKNYMQSNPMTGVTELALCTAAFTGPLTVKDTQKAFEKTRQRDIKAWSQSYIGPTALAKRRETFNNGVKL